MWSLLALTKSIVHHHCGESMKELGDRDNYGPAHVYCCRNQLFVCNAACSSVRGFCFLLETIALCLPILLQAHRCVPQMDGPGITMLKSNLTVTLLHADPITGEFNRGVENMQQVFVYKANAQKVMPDLERFTL